MSEPFAKHHPREAIEVDSAGTSPSDKVDPVVAEVMKEKGIDISHAEPKLLTPEVVERADQVVTMGCALPEELAPEPIAD